MRRYQELIDTKLREGLSETVDFDMLLTNLKDFMSKVSLLHALTPGAIEHPSPLSALANAIHPGPSATSSSRFPAALPSAGAKPDARCRRGPGPTDIIGRFPGREPYKEGWGLSSCKGASLIRCRRCSEVLFAAQFIVMEPCDEQRRRPCSR